MNKLLSVVIIASVGLSACGEQKSRVYKKQRTPTTLKIEKLDLKANNLGLRFNYRSYVEKTLENIQCDIDINKAHIKLNKTLNIQLGAFATEVVNFNEITSNLDQLKNQTRLNYSLICHIEYNQGKENIRESSALHLTPGEKFIYR